MVFKIFSMYIKFGGENKTRRTRLCFVVCHATRASLILLQVQLRLHLIGEPHISGVIEDAKAAVEQFEAGTLTQLTVI